jgi:hypothetical protein
MRFRFLCLAASAVALAGAFPALGQQSGGEVSGEQRDIGRVDAHIQKYGQALGVVSRLSRPLGAETECYGTCFFPSSSRPISWRCAPKAMCDLHCDVNPPAGGCH